MNVTEGGNHGRLLRFSPDKMNVITQLSGARSVEQVVGHLMVQSTCWWYPSASRLADRLSLAKEQLEFRRSTGGVFPQKRSTFLTISEPCCSMDQTLTQGIRRWVALTGNVLMKCTRGSSSVYVRILPMP